MFDPSFTLYLARHGETEYNRTRRMQGRSIDASLNEKGWMQARALADRFEETGLSTVYSSGLARARETAATVAERLGLRPEILDTLAEMFWGNLEGLKIDSVRPYLAEVSEAWRVGEFGHAVGGGETILDVQARAQESLDRLTGSHGSGERVLAVTHGRFLRVILATALPGKDLTCMDEFAHANTGVYELLYTGNGFTLVMSNCTTHLKSLRAAS